MKKKIVIQINSQNLKEQIFDEKKYENIKTDNIKK